MFAIIVVAGGILVLLMLPVIVLNLMAADYFLDAAHRMRTGTLDPDAYHRERGYRVWSRWNRLIGGR